MTDPKRIAREVLGYVSDAVSDAASGMLDFPNLADDKWKKKIKKAKKDGVRDLHGWLADELYNDPDTLEDLMGDRICDGISEQNGDSNSDFCKVLDELEKIGHEAVVKACKELRKSH